MEKWTFQLQCAALLIALGPVTSWIPFAAAVGDRRRYHGCSATDVPWRGTRSSSWRSWLILGLTTRFRLPFWDGLWSWCSHFKLHRPHVCCMSTLDCTSWYTVYNQFYSSYLTFLAGLLQPHEDRSHLSENTFITIFIFTFIYSEKVNRKEASLLQENIHIQYSLICWPLSNSSGAVGVKSLAQGHLNSGN